MTEYVVRTGLTWKTKNGAVRRAEPGDVVSDVPKDSVAWLVEQGHIEKVT